MLSSLCLHRGLFDGGEERLAFFWSASGSRKGSAGRIALGKRQRTQPLSALDLYPFCLSQEEGGRCS